MTNAQTTTPRGFFAARTNWNLETNRLGAALARHRADGKPVLDLTASNPTRCGFRYDEAALLPALANPAALVYEPQPQGLSSAREAVAEYYADRSERVSAADILLTTSTSEAYSFAFRLLCDAGDEILVPAPSYPLFDFLADVLDVKVVRYPLLYDYGWQIDFDVLERAITPTTRAVIVVHPNNPTGNFCSPDEAAKLEEICSRRRIALIADEVFLDFALPPEPAGGGDVLARPLFRSFAVTEGCLAFTLSGLSKICGLPQMKFAWMVVSGPQELKSSALAHLDVIADTYLSMNAPIQHAASSFLAQRSALQAQLMDRVRRNLAELDRQLAAQESCSRLKMQGGWYAVLRVPRTRSDEELAVELLEKKNVYVHPGHFYDFAGEGYLVVSLMSDPAQFQAGVAALLTAA